MWGAIGGALIGAIASDKKNKANAAATQQSIEFEREKAQNAHQWEVEDLRKAGLNPILSAGGSGASTGSPTIIPSGESPFAGGLNSALATKSAQEQIRKIEADADASNEKAKQERLNAENLADASNYFEPILDENGKQVYEKGMPMFKHRNLVVERYKNEAVSSALQNQIFSEQLDALKYDNVQRELNANIYSSPYGKYLYSVEKALNIAGKGASLVYGLGRGFNSSNYYFNYK